MSTNLVTLTIQPNVTAFTAAMHMAAYHIARYEHLVAAGERAEARSGSGVGMGEGPADSDGSQTYKRPPLWADSPDLAEEDQDA